MRQLQTKVLILILLTALFFRFYNIKQFQFWFSDEEVNAMVVRKVIVEKKPVLISPNSTTGLTFGPYFHLASVPIFYAAQMNPETALAVMGLLGVLTTYIIFLVGKATKNIKFALVASFLYSSSFVISLFDRRWWPLSMCPITSAVAILSVYKIYNNKKYLWSVPLVISLSFGFHADPTIGILTLSTIITYIILKIPILKKEYLWIILVLVVFLAPLVVFEIRHPGAVTHPILVSLQKNTSPQPGNLPNIFSDISTKTAIMLSNSSFPKPSSFAETFVASGFSGFNSQLAIINLPVIIFLIILPIFYFNKIKNEEKTLVIILLTFLATFILGLFLYAIFYKKPIAQHFYTIAFPPFILLVAYSLTRFIKNQKILIACLLIYLSVNLLALLESSFRYPLYQKRELTKILANEIGASNFSLYQQGDAYFIGGGFPILFNLEDKYPKKSNAYEYYDWMYQAHGLFTTKIENIDQEKVVIISKEPQNQYPIDKILNAQKVGKMYSIILDNKDNWYGKD